MAELARGSFMPLFDRLGAATPSPAGQGAMLSPEQMQASIARELAQLLNTRCALSVAEFAQADGTTLDYGIPDLGFLSPLSQEDLGVLQSTVRLAIERFEPRIHQVQVLARPATSGAGGPHLQISGMVTIGMKLRQLHFEMQIDPAARPTTAGAN